MLWGLPIGLFGFIGFFLVIGVTITTFGIAFAFIVAMFAALTIQGCSLWLVNGRK